MFTHYEEKAKEMGYFVDKDGQAYSPRGNKVGTRSKGGYLYIGIRVSKVLVIKVMVHRLQAYQKYGNKIYDRNLEIRHLNNDHTDNSFQNIGIGTHKQNMLDLPKEDRVRYAKNASGFTKKQKRISDEVAIEIKKKNQKGVSYKQLMKEYGISSLGTISFIVNKRMINIAAGCKGSISL